MSALSDRLTSIADALPLTPGMRVLEIGGGTGAASRAVAASIGEGHVCMIDRSAKAVAQAEKNAATEIGTGVVSVRQVAIKDFELHPADALFDLAFAVRVGALDGRHPETGQIALQRIVDSLTSRGLLFVDGDFLHERQLPPRSDRLMVDRVQRCRRPSRD